MTAPYQEDWDRLIDDIEENAENSRAELADGDEELEQLLEQCDQNTINMLRDIEP